MIFTHFSPETDPASIPRTVDVLLLVSRTNNSGNPVHAWKQARHFGPLSLPVSDEDAPSEWATQGEDDEWYAPEGFYLLTPDEEQYQPLDPAYTIHGWQPLPPAVVPAPVQWIDDPRDADGILPDGTRGIEVRTFVSGNVAVRVDTPTTTVSLTLPEWAETPQQRKRIALAFWHWVQWLSLWGPQK